MSSGFVRMLLYLSMRQSSGGVSLFLKIFLFIFLGLLSYSCWYFDIVFFICFSEYSVVIFRASFLAFFAFWLSFLSMYCVGEGGLGVLV